MESKVIRLLGLAANAGKVITGIYLCEKAAKRKKAKLIVLTRETEEGTVNLFLKFKVPVIYVKDKETLGKYTGKSLRTVAVITDKGFAEAILKESGEA